MMRNNGITGWAAVNRGLRGQENPSEGRGSGGEASTELGSGWWFGEGGQDGQAWSTPVTDTDFTPRAGGTGSNAQSTLVPLSGLQSGSTGGLGIRGQETPRSLQQFRQVDYTPLL